MRILYASLEPPYPPVSGHRLRIWNTLRALAEEGRQVTLVSFYGANEEPPIAAVEKLCPAVAWVPLEVRGADYAGRLRALGSRLPYNARRYQSRAFRNRVNEFLQENAYEAIVCDEIYHLQNIPTGNGVPVWVDTMHVAHELLQRYTACQRNPLKRLYGEWEARKMESWERDECQRASGIWACSQREREIYDGICPSLPVALVPNTVDVEEYGRSDGVGDGATLLYTGTMEWFPNQDAAAYFITEVLPKVREQVPEARFVVAGRGVPECFRRRFSGPAVEFTGAVPDMHPWIARAAVVVVPLRIGGGTRLKILEAGAMAKAIVATPFGAEGLDFVDGREIVLADRADEFAAAVVKLLRDTPRRCALGQAARERVTKQYSLPALRAALRAVLSMGAGPAAAKRSG